MNELLLRRRALMMAQKKSRLPSEYQEVEYLESTGEAQWIDVGFPITDTLSVEIAFSATVDSSTDKYFMGLYSGNRGDFYIYYNASGWFQTAYGCPFVNTNVKVSTDKHKFVYTFEAGNTVVKENNTTIASKAKHTPLRTDRHIMIAGTSYSNQNKTKTYSFLAYNGASKVADFVPCYRKSDRKPGMYDLVTKTFFTNQGTGEFIVGADVN